MNWGQVKKMIDESQELGPKQTINAVSVDEGSHDVGGDKHTLRKFEVWVDGVEDKYDVFFKYAICPSCQLPRFKKMIAYNHVFGLSYEKNFMKLGKQFDETVGMLEALL